MARNAPKTQKAAARKPRSARKEPAISRAQKPVFRVGTLITLVLFAGLIVFAMYINRQKETSAKETPTGQPSLVFTAADGTPASIEVKPADGDAVKLVYNAATAWAIELPTPAKADQGLAEGAASQISTLRVLDRIDAAPSIFGLDKPGFVITIEFSGGKKHILEVGDATPTNTGYYVRLDNDKMFVVSLNGIDPLLNLVKAPPYLNTPTPTALPPTETPIPPTEPPTSTSGTTVTPAP